MTEPTLKETEACWDVMHGKFGPLNTRELHLMAIYANHATAEMQAKIDRLEIGLMELEKVAGRLKAKNDELRATHVPKEDAWDAVCNGSRKDKARIATLEAELAARDFVPITEAHKDGEEWNLRKYADIGTLTAVGKWQSEPKFKGYPWETLGGHHAEDDFTHAARLPQPPKEGE